MPRPSSRTSRAGECARLAGAYPLELVASSVENLGGPNGDQARLAVANVLAQQALDPQGLPEGSDLGRVASTAFRLVSTPEDATRFLENLGPEGATRLLDQVGLSSPVESMSTSS